LSLRPHGFYHSACLLVYSPTHNASSIISTTTSRHKPSVYPSPSQHILHPHGNPPLRMPYIVTTNASNISDFVAKDERLPPVLWGQFATDVADDIRIGASPMPI
ncbi:hypothetical protein HID58_042201, partial [Brassica napus]